MTVEELKAMRGGDVLAHQSETLLKWAAGFRQCVQMNSNIDPSQWDWTIHDVACAAAELIERIRATGKDQVERKVKVDRLVELSVDVCRSTLIGEALKRDQAPATVAPPADPDEAAA